MKYFCLLLMFISFPHVLFCSKKHMYNWYFGRHAGITFNTPSGSPEALTDGQINTSEGAACFSDANGNLLMYTDGNTIWNRNHEVMANGTGLKGHQSAVQGVLILPKPCSESLYYIFTVNGLQEHEKDSKEGFHFSIVDMNRQDGLGEVIEKNTLVYEYAFENVISTVHANGTDYWLLVRDEQSPRYRSYLFSAQGLQLEQVTNMNFPGAAPWGTFYIEPMKFSSDGRTMVSVRTQANSFEILDFDNSSGKLSNWLRVELDYPCCRQRVMEISPDGTKLYLSTIVNGPTIISQFDISSRDPATIKSSEVQLSGLSEDRFTVMQLGPDDKIYVTNDDELVVIGAPNAKGLGCRFGERVIPLKGGYSHISLPNIPRIADPAPVSLGIILGLASVDTLVHIGQMDFGIPLYLDIKETSACVGERFLQNVLDRMRSENIEFSVTIDRRLFQFTAWQGSATLVDQRQDRNKLTLNFAIDEIELQEERLLLGYIKGQVLLSKILESPIAFGELRGLDVTEGNETFKVLLTSADGSLKVDQVCLHQHRHIRLNDPFALSITNNFVSEELVVEYTLPSATRHELYIVTMLGEKLPLVDTYASGGSYRHSVHLGEYQLPGGQYFLLLSAQSNHLWQGFVISK